MNILLTADLHLTDLPRDEYRWGIFEWIAKQVKPRKIGMVALLGDLTDAKDKHSGELANRLVDQLALLGRACPVIFDPGNHDGIQEGRPFFRFTNHIPNVTCLVEPLTLEREGKEYLFLPNTRDYKSAWTNIDFNEPDYTLCHQTFDGCITENGTRLGGIPPSVFAKIKGLVYSGDIHVPQKIGKNIEYVGAPYRIRFGDSFAPRILMIGSTPKGKHQQQDLHFPTTMKFLIEVEGDNLRKLFLKELDRLDVRTGDQVKLRVILPRSEYAEWPTIRTSLIDAAITNRIELWGPELHAREDQTAKPAKGQLGADPKSRTPDKALLSYARRERLSGPLLDAGRSFLAGAQEKHEKS